MNKIAQALAIARSGVGTSEYQLGTGDWDSAIGGRFDCFGFAVNKCYGIKRHRPGFNRGPWSSVEDDLNCNSAIEDAQHKKELFVEITVPEAVMPGDLLAYPTFTINDAVFDQSGRRVTGHEQHKFIGHIAIIDTVKPNWRHYSDLTVIQCCGPNGRRPGILRGFAWHWDQHDSVWPKSEHKTHILRPIQGAV